MIRLMLDATSVERLLTTPWRVEVRGEVTSTNDLVRDAARVGAVEGLVITAESQTQGRGRYGRPWADIPGRCLLFSVLLRPPTKNVAPLLGLAAGASVLMALRPCCRDLLGLRWPNDLVCNGKKLAGILVEGVADAYVVGVGINVFGRGSELSSGRPAVTVEELVALAEGTRTPSREELLAATLNALCHHYRTLVAGHPGGLLDVLRAADQLAGHHITVQSNGVCLEGVAAGLDDMGRLGVRTADGLRWLSAGEVTTID
ncbi:MAG: biotin--[acetyl-CoA-carboxylase] ligase [Armatimonadota bacterium]